MLNQTIELEKVFPEILKTNKCALECFIPRLQLDGRDTGARQAVLVCPGGGYGMVSDREAEPIALAFAARGYNAYILTYSVKGSSNAEYPVQLLQALAAVKFITDCAASHNTDSSKISVCGFSAGGHLACMAATLQNCDDVNKAIGKNKNFKIWRSILSYPVISSGSAAHLGSFDNLCGKDEKLKKELSLENRVDKNTPPAFLWHTSNDNCVDVRNSLLYADALKVNGVKFEMHIYPSGVHGLALANVQTSVGNPALIQPDAESWVELADKFLKKEF